MLAINLCLITGVNLSAENYMYEENNWLHSDAGNNWFHPGEENNWNHSDNSCCNNLNVQLCNPCYTWGLEGSALYLQPSGSNLHYVAEAEPLPVPSPNWIIKDVHPDYHFGFELGASAINHDRNSITKLNYVHFYSKDTSSFVAGTNDMVGPFFEIGPDASAFSNAKGEVSFHHDALNLDYGICVAFGDYVHTNFFGGLGAVRLKQNFKSTYSSSNGSVSRSIDVPSSFYGIGPQLGFDVSYEIWDCLQLTGKSTATLFVGNFKNHTSYKTNSPALATLGITPPNSQSTSVNHRTGVVPAYEGKLGLSYDFKICDFLFNIAAGYEVLIYLDAIQSIDMGSEVDTPPVVPSVVGVFARTFQRNTSNFALAGPYLRLNVDF
jgi:hypothetical protein